MPKIDMLFQRLLEGYQMENGDLLLIYYNLWQYYKGLNEHLEQASLPEKIALFDRYAEQSAQLGKLLEHKLKGLEPTLQQEGAVLEHLPEISEDDPQLPEDLRLMIEQWHEERTRFSRQLNATKKSQESKNQ